jgi:hypothetical protein
MRHVAVASSLGVVVASALVLACSRFSAADDTPASTARLDGAAPLADSSADGTVFARDAASEADATSLAEPPTFLSPSTPISALVTPEPIDYELGFLLPAPTITTSSDGTALNKTSGVTSIVFRSVQANTTIHWTVNDAPQHTFAVNVDSSLTNSAGYIIYNVRFSAIGGGPLVVAQPSQDLAAQATFKYWDPSTKRHQLIYGIGDTATACLSDSSAGAYDVSPVRGDNVGFHITAPGTSGVYQTRVAYTSAPDCTAALATKLSDVAVAEIIVK